MFKPGDTPEIIAKKLGLSGQEAKDCAAKIKEDAQKSGKYYKFGFKAGDSISLPGNYTDAINKMKKNGTYFTDLMSINKDFIDKTNKRLGIQTETVKAKETPQKPTGTESVSEIKTPAPATHIDGYKEPKNTITVSLNELQKDEQGRYIIPKGNYAIDSSEIPADDIKFVLADKDSTLVFKGKLDSKEASNYKEPVTADIIIRDSDPSNETYKSGDFEYKGGNFYYQGKEINPDEWDIQINDFNNYATGKHAGISIHAVKKDTVQKSDEIKHTQRNIDISGPGKVYAQEVSCPFNLNVGNYEIGAIRKGTIGSLKGNGNIQEFNVGNNTGLTLIAENQVNIRNLKSGMLFGDNVNVSNMKGGKYSAKGTVHNLYCGEFSAADSNIVIMNGGHVLAANSIKIMQGGYLDLYKVRYSNPGKTIIENYIAGRIDSCDKAVVVIQNGLNKALLAQADSPLKEKRGGIISDKEPKQDITPYNVPNTTQTAGIGNTIVSWFKKLFN